MPLVKAYDEVENPRIQRTLPNGHFGWRGIRERAEQIHAQVNLTSQPGHGTTVVVTVPIAT